MTTHISGLTGSGLDIDSLVEQAMKGQRARYDTLTQRKTQLEWKKSSYNTMYTSINSFRNTVFNYKLGSTLSPKNASTSNDNVVSITTGADAASTNHSLIISNMAEGVNLTSSSTITTGTDKNTLASQFGLAAGQKFTIKVTNGSVSKDIEVDTDKSIYDFISNLNSAGVNVKANYDTTVDRLFLYTTNTGSSAGMDFSGSSAQGLSFITNNLKIAATAAPVSSVTSTSSIGLNPLKAPLANQFADMAVAVSFDINIKDTVSNATTTVNINPQTDTLESMMTKINNAGGSGAKALVNYNASTGKLTLISGIANPLQITASNADGTAFISNDLKLPTDIPNTGASSTANIGLDTSKCLDDTLANQLGMTGSVTLNINGKSVTVDSTDTVNGLMTKINGMGANAAATYNAATGKISINATSGTLDFSQNGADGLSFLSNKLKMSLQNKGQDADITLDGVQFTESSNVFTIAGLTYTLKGESPTTPIVVSVHDDIDKTVDNVKKFIDAYNKMLDQVNTAVDEPVYRDYLPLTSDQKSAMKDSDISLWEARAKSGLLHNDPSLQSLAYSMRANVSNPIAGITGKYNSAASIGITTGDYTEKGKLYLDDAGEAKLRKALQEDPDIVQKIFGSTSDDVSKQGIAVKLYDTLKNASDKIVTTAGTTATATYDTQSTLGKEIRDYNDRMYDMSKRLKDIEDRYYQQYSALETALSKMNQQSSWLSQQLGSK